jgi:MraZ protein
MFAGRYDHSLDEKGRTMVPKRFRGRLAELGDESVWITNALGTPNHLDVRPSSLFKVYQDRIALLTETPQLLLYKRFYFGSAIEVEIDSAGRILVPVSLRNRPGLTDRIAFVGLDGERFQLWRPQDLDLSFEYCSQNSAELLAHLAELGG